MANKAGAATVGAKKEVTMLEGISSELETRIDLLINLNCRLEELIVKGSGAIEDGPDIAPPLDGPGLAGKLNTQLERLQDQIIRTRDAIVRLEEII